LYPVVEYQNKEGFVIPVISFLNEIFSGVKGPYYRLVGRHTQRFLGRSVKSSTNERQKKILFIATAGVDDFFAKSFSVQSKPASLLARNPIEKKLKTLQVTTTFRVYLSTLLILLGTERAQLLTSLELNEADWIQRWCWVFEYHAEDMAYYQELLPAGKGDDWGALSQNAARLLAAALSSAGECPIDINEELLRTSLLQDLSSIQRVFIAKSGA